MIKCATILGHKTNITPSSSVSYSSASELFYITKLGVNTTFTIKKKNLQKMLTFWTAPSWFFYSISIRCLTFIFFSFAKSEMSPAKVVSAAWVWVLFVVLCCVAFGGQRFLQ